MRTVGAGGPSRAASLLTFSPQTLTFRRFLAASAVNAAINTVIALIITAVGVGKGFRTTFIFSQCIGFAIYFANLAAYPLFRRTVRTATRAAVLFTAVTTGALSGTVLGAVANGIRPLSFLREHGGYFTQVVVFALLFGFVISYIYLSLVLLSDAKVRRLETEKAAMEAELRLVQSQMEPHFLFNTLANVRSLIDSDPRRAGEMLETFVAFLRTSLRTGRERTVPLAQELDGVKRYLDLIVMRMGGRLRYTIDLPAALRAVPVPPLLVQPLVENAVKHGLEPSIDGGAVTVTAARTDTGIMLQVVDTGIGMREAGCGGGIGLENVRRRISLLYGDAGRLVLAENDPTGVKAVIELPEQE